MDLLDRLKSVLRFIVKLGYGDCELSNLLLLHNSQWSNYNNVINQKKYQKIITKLQTNAQILSINNI